MTPAQLVALVALGRVAELILAHCNTKALRARGAVEIGARHYPAIVAVHVLWLTALMAWGRIIDPFWLVVFVLLQVGRFWVLATLGSRWTTRILILPGAPLITTGPYRFLSHPNYAVVMAEIAVLPLCLGLPGVALVFSLANAAVLALRISAENAALERNSHVAPTL